MSEVRILILMGLMGGANLHVCNSWLCITRMIVNTMNTNTEQSWSEEDCSFLSGCACMAGQCLHKPTQPFKPLRLLIFSNTKACSFRQHEPAACYISCGNDGKPNVEHVSQLIDCVCGRCYTDCTHTLCFDSCS